MYEEAKFNGEISYVYSYRKSQMINGTTLNSESCMLTSAQSQQSEHYLFSSSRRWFFFLLSNLRFHFLFRKFKLSFMKIKRVQRNAVDVSGIICGRIKEKKTRNTHHFIFIEYLMSPSADFTCSVS